VVDREGAEHLAALFKGGASTEGGPRAGRDQESMTVHGPD
jgi:hypothetical protein